MKPIIVPDDTDPKRKASRDFIAGALGRALMTAYPGRDWMVKVSHDLTVASVFCAQISLEWGYTLHTNVPLHQLEAKARMAGGELLERFGLHRGKGDGEDASVLLRDGRGNVISARQGERV